MKEGVDPRITYTTHYMVFDAAIAAGATLDELARLDDYPKSFLAKLIAWHKYSMLIKAHSEDAAMSKPRKGK